MCDEKDDYITFLLFIGQNGRKKVWLREEGRVELAGQFVKNGF